MQEALEKHDILWSNCVGIVMDNTSVNLGCRNSIKTRIQGVNSAIYIMGCPCHIVHNIAGKASHAFESVSTLYSIHNHVYHAGPCIINMVSGFNVDDLVIDLFYWFDKSTKRKAGMLEYCTFCDINYREIVKHVNTRWLSLERAIH